MATCEHLPGCAFFNDKLANMPLVSEILKEQYCLADWTRCARFLVSSTGKPAPLDLFPDDQNRVPGIVGSPTEP